ncbi:hypothetical protein EVA_04666 [gut metagenome]|uniref:Uncharacterized protein n=1 Tax=gut metagenome TaxID=749906 RepID=J9D3J1_9ZZZZ
MFLPRRAPISHHDSILVLPFHPIWLSMNVHNGNAEYLNVRLPTNQAPSA